MIDDAVKLLDDAFAASGGDFGEASGAIGGCDVVVSVAHDQWPGKPLPAGLNEKLCWVWRWRNGRFEKLTKIGGPHEASDLVLMLSTPAKVIMNVARLAELVDEHVDGLVGVMSVDGDVYEHAGSIISFVCSRIENNHEGAEKVFALLDITQGVFTYEKRTMQDGSIVWVVIHHDDKESVEDLIDAVFCWADNDVWVIKVRLQDGETQDCVQDGWFGTDWLRNGAAAWVVDEVKEMNDAD